MKCPVLIPSAHTQFSIQQSGSFGCIYMSSNCKLCVFVMYVINKLQFYSLFVAQCSIGFELSVLVSCSSNCSS
jgi:hypothetical protein